MSHQVCPRCDYLMYNEQGQLVCPNCSMYINLPPLFQGVHHARAYPSQLSAEEHLSQ